MLEKSTSLDFYHPVSPQEEREAQLVIPMNYYMASKVESPTASKKADVLDYGKNASIPIPAVEEEAEQQKFWNDFLDKVTNVCRQPAKRSGGLCMTDENF